MSDYRHSGSDGIRELMVKLPGNIQEVALNLHDEEQVEEIVMDIGRPLWIVTAAKGPQCFAEIMVRDLDIESFIGRIGTIKDDNRTGIEGTLHRVSVIRDRDSPAIIGVTIRFGSPVFGVAEGIRAELSKVSGMMVIGPPAKGKTTLLRDIVRISSELIDPVTGFLIGPRIVIVDTSGDIGGHGKITHPVLGAARRIPVSMPQEQTRLILQAIGNHSPILIVVDEIRNLQEAEALATSAMRGVKPIATCHGEQLAETIGNPTFWPVLGDLRFDPVTQKLRRFARPIFNTATEVWDKGRYVVHPDLTDSIDRILLGELPRIRLVGNWTEAQQLAMAEQVRWRILGKIE